VQIRPLDKGSHLPLYVQLQEALTSQIGSGDVKPGDRLPSERELAGTLGISRITARLALDALLENGLVYREQGRGTFVAEPKMRGLKGFLSFTEDIMARGMTPRSRILAQEAITPDESIASALKLPSDALVLRLTRLRFADDEPVALQSSYIPLHLCPGLESADLTDKSLFSVLRKQYFVHPIWTEAEVEAVPASAEEAQWLEMSMGAPLLEVKGLTFTESFEVVESVRTVYRTFLPVYIGRQRL
jgi:GntR family transcriptional regulator